MSLMFLFFVLFSVVMVWQSVVQVAPHQRAIVLRFGRFHAYLGPGLAFIVPFYDRTHLVDLEHEVPGWRAMQEAQLEDAVRSRVFGASRGRT